METKSSLFSIGHGHKSLEEFLEELLAFDVQFLVDVRSTPYSKWSPLFNQNNIELFLKEHNIRYIYMGDTIGGRPTDDTCYDSEGYFDYERMAAMPEFKSGIQRLVNANKLGYRVAVMCSEADPTLCHRSKLIGRELYFSNNIDMKHIISPTAVISEPEIITTLTKGKWSLVPTLFDTVEEFQEKPYFKSRNPYKKDSEQDYCND